jgi:hypothetical protein
MNYPQIKPTLNLDFSNTKTLDPRINFRRGTPGAYYDGKTYAKAEENLISYSEDFSNAYYTHSSVNVTTESISDPSGQTSEVYKIIETTDTGGHNIYNTMSLVSGKKYSLSVYAKISSGSRFLQMRLTGLGGNAGFANFDLTGDDGSVVGYLGAVLSADIVSVGDWYRCSMVFHSTSVPTGISFALATDFVDFDEYTGDGSSGFYIWGAQLEQRDAVTAYTPTNGAPVTKYQPQLMFASPDQPRFDHDVLTGESKGLLIEESRTNLIEYSEDFDNAAWNGNGTAGSSVSSNVVVAPDGTLTADKIVEDTSTGDHRRSQALTATAVGHTATVYLKAGGRSIGCVFIYDSTTRARAYFNLSSGTIVSTTVGTATITPVGNGWYRCSVSGTFASTSVRMFASLSADGTTQSYTGDGYSGIYIWGAQLEEGSFATSYIKTSGAPSGTERSADNASITGENFSSWYRQDEGSIYLSSEVHESRTASTYEILNLYKDSSNYIAISNTGRELISSLYTNGSTQTQLYNQFKSQTPYTINSSVGYKKDSASLFNKGEQVMSEDTPAEIPSGLDKLFIGNRNNSFWTGKLYIKKLAYYPQRLTNEQLQNLTK